MLTELANNQQKRKQIENGIKLCEEAISKAEKYERLSENKDWLAYLEDLQVLISLHDREIKLGCNAMIEAPSHPYAKHDVSGSETVVNSKQDWSDFIVRHEIQKAELSNWVKEPERILEFAKVAREKLPILKEKLSEISDGSSEKPSKS